MCPPTLIFLGGLVAAAAFEAAEPFPIDPNGLTFWQILASAAAIAFGIGLFVWSIATFARARTGIMLQQPARSLVTGGPYGRSRNPQYLGFIACYVGAALLLNSLWAIILLPAVVGALALVVIEREERYLANVFGPTYETYCRSVGRWM